VLLRDYDFFSFYFYEYMTEFKERLPIFIERLFVSGIESSLKFLIKISGTFPSLVLPAFYPFRPAFYSSSLILGIGSLMI
jgi:hypothetical protein